MKKLVLLYVFIFLNIAIAQGIYDDIGSNDTLSALDRKRARLYDRAIGIELEDREKEIELEDNQYKMENICYNANEISKKSKSFYRYYKFIFKSKYNVFENYENAYGSTITFKTNLYTIISSSHEWGVILKKNKKVIETILNEEQMKKLYESNSVKVFFDRSIFANNYTTGQPVLSISLNKNNFNHELEKCTKKYDKYIKEHNEHHSKPMNRIKDFFNF